MLANLETLRSLMESSTNYEGARVDTMPGVTITECVSMFNEGINQMHMDAIMESQQINESIVEATIQCITEGATNTDAMDAIVEEAGKGIVANIQKFFNWAKRWLETIAHKVRTFVEQFFSKGAEMYSKYASQVKDLTGFKAQGFKYGHINYSIPKADALVTAIMPVGMGTFNPETAGNHVEAMKNLELKDIRKKVMGNILTDVTFTEKWKADIRDKYVGKKVELDGTYLDDVEEVLTGKKYDKDAIVREYKTLIDQVKKDEKDSKQFAAKHLKEIEDKKARKQEKLSDAYSNLVTYCNTYTKVYGEALKGINNTKQAMLQIISQEASQAQRIFGAMVRYTPPKSGAKEEAIGESFDMFDDFDVEL